MYVVRVCVQRRSSVRVHYFAVENTIEPNILYQVLISSLVTSKFDLWLILCAVCADADSLQMKPYLSPPTCQGTSSESGDDDREIIVDRHCKVAREKLKMLDIAKLLRGPL